MGSDLLDGQVYMLHEASPRRAIMNNTKTLIEKYNIKDKVELILEKGQIVIKPLRNPRKGWEKAFAEMAENGDDKLLFDDVFNPFMNLFLRSFMRFV